MKLEIYQIIVPFAGALFILGLLRRFWMSKASWQEALVGGTFWLGIILFALFPDFFSNLIARIFGIKSNINAVIFFCIGLIFFIQYRLFFMLKKQETALTTLTRRLALEDAQKKSAT
jgi:hypothetical protein